MGDDLMPKLIKCLELTASDNDGEALNAIRKANSFRAKIGKTWTELFFTNKVIHQPSYSYKPPKIYKKKTAGAATCSRINKILVFLLNKNLSDGAKTFVKSLNEQFEENNTLTDKQIAALERIYQQYGGTE